MEYLAHNISKKLEIYKNLEEVCENSSYKKEWEWFTEVLLLETKMDGVIVWKTIIEYKKFDKEVYKLNGKRISKNNLIETIKKGVYMVPIKHEKNYHIFNRIYRTIEEFETALNN